MDLSFLYVRYLKKKGLSINSRIDVGEQVCGVDLSNLHSHEVFCKDDITLEDISARIDDVGGVTHRIEMGEEEPPAMGIRRDFSSQRWSEVAFDLSPLGKRALHDEEIRFTGEVHNRFAVIRVPGHRDRSPIAELDSVSDTFRGVSHRPGEDLQVVKNKWFFRNFCDAELVRSRFDPSAVYLFELIEVIFKSWAPKAKKVFFTRKVGIFTRKKNGNKICNVVGVEMRIEQEVDIVIRHPDVEHSPQDSGPAVNQHL